MKCRNITHDISRAAQTQAQLTGIFATAAYVWNSEEEARAFLTTPHALLQGRSPLDVSLTELGARRVEELLWRLFYGIAA